MFFPPAERDIPLTGAAFALVLLNEVVDEMDGELGSKSKLLPKRMKIRRVYRTIVVKQNLANLMLLEQNPWRFHQYRACLMKCPIVVVLFDDL